MNNERNSKPTEKLTVAGIAAVIVVGVFVVCVILILAKSLFPSNTDSVPDGVYTGTAKASTVTTTTNADALVESTPDSTSDSTLDSLLDSDADSASDSSYDDSSAADDSTSDSSEADGETATLNQTAYLRSSNDENSDPLLSISAGETVTVVERPSDSEYVHVTYGSYDGWVWNGYLD
jgi:uncharacterized protein YgiM (DUF1202 family)